MSSWTSRITSFFSGLRTESTSGTPGSLTNTSTAKSRRCAANARPKGPQPPCPEVMKMVVDSRQIRSSKVRLSYRLGPQRRNPNLKQDQPQVKSRVCS